MSRLIQHAAAMSRAVINQARPTLAPRSGIAPGLMNPIDMRRTPSTSWGTSISPVHSSSVIAGPGSAHLRVSVGRMNEIAEMDERIRRESRINSPR